MTMRATINDGWDDEEDLAALNDGWSDADDGLDAISATNEGWGDDDLDLDLDDVKKEDPETKHGTMMANAFRASTAIAPVGIAGWEEEDNSGWDDESGAGTNNIAPATTGKDTVVEPAKDRIIPDSSNTKMDGWDDDDDLDLDSVNDTLAPPKPPTLPPKPPLPPARALTQLQESMYRKLQNYMDVLPNLVTSLNAVLEAEYNTPTHAMHLLEYYDARPQLMAYTLDIELPRMDYQVTTAEGITITDKQQVKNYLQSQPNSILTRAANQSLLADLFTVMTGDVIVPTFLATAICTSCKFVMDQSSVHAQCCMSLSLPNGNGDRMHVAEIIVGVMLDPGDGVVMYQVKQIRADLVDTAAFKGTAVFLSEMDIGSIEDQRQQYSADAVRDNFLKQLSKTQQMAQQTSTGLTSAWRQIDRVANVSTKVNALSKLMLTLPSSADIMATQESPSTFLKSERPSTQTHSQQRSRPQPLLGGFLMSGLSRLANTIVPEDNSNQETVPSLYRKDGPPTRQAPPTLRPTEPPVQNPPSFYRRTNSPEASRHQPLSQQQIKVNDGWHDDDEELNFDDIDDEYGDSLFNSKPCPLPNVAGVESKTPPPQQKPMSHIENTVLLHKIPSAPSMSYASIETKPQIPVQRTELAPEASDNRQQIQGEPDEDLVPPILYQEYPPVPPPLVDYNPEDDIIPTRVRWTRSR